jgi:membrane protein
MTTRTVSDHIPPSSSKHRPVAAASREAAASGGFQPKKRLRLLGALLKETVTQWQDDEAPRLAASLSLYTLLSLAPLLIVSIAIAGMVLGQEAARGQISQQMSGVVGSQAGEAIEAMIANARAPGKGIVGSAVGIVVLLFGASGVFGELQTALNQIWNVKPRPGRGVMGFIRDRFFSFSMVTGVAFLLLVSLVVSAVLATLTEHFRGLVPLPVLWQALNVVISLGVTTALFALIFKVVPDARITWRDVWVGAFATAVLFSFGKILLGWYVGRSATVSPFGAAGSLVALIVWVYYSAQILFFGAEFAQVYATRFGSRIVPTANAVPADEATSQRSPEAALPPNKPRSELN